MVARSVSMFGFGLFISLLFSSIVFSQDPQDSQNPLLAEKDGGTKGTIGIFCIDQNGKRHDWQSMRSQSEVFKRCLSDVREKWEALETLESYSPHFDLITQWYFKSFESWIQMARTLSCEEDVLDAWDKQYSRYLENENLPFTEVKAIEAGKKKKDPTFEQDSGKP